MDDLEAQLDAVCKNLEQGVGFYATARRDLMAARLMSDGLVAILVLRAKLAPAPAPPPEAPTP